MSSPSQALATVIENCQPKAMVALGELGKQLAQRWAEHQSCDVSVLAPEVAAKALSLSKIQDLALVTDALEQLDFQQGQTLIGLLRNYGTRQIAVLVSDDSGWTDRDFIGLGFKRQEKFARETDSQVLTLYTYNINNYNHKRTWNNPQHWANPHMWNKAWW